MVGDHQTTDASVFDRYDVFVSYAHGDIEKVRPLVDALRAHKLSVWFDESDIETHASITRSVQHGVAKSKVLVAYYSATYPSRRACQWEMTAAFTAAQREGRNPRERVLVVNPERTADGGMCTDHVWPLELRDGVFATGDPNSAGEWDEEARRIGTVVAGLTSVLGDEPIGAPRQVGRRLVGAPGFVGRLQQLWTVHSALSGSDVVLVSGATGGDVAQLAGMGGVGKSLLAEEYALRFGSAYPGGIFWLNASEAHGDGTNVGAADRDADRHTQLRLIASDLGMVVEGRSPEEIRGALGVELERAGRCLWIVDDLPTDLTSDEVRDWLAPHPSGRTLITTRGRRFQLATRIDLDRLEPDEGYELLTSTRHPETQGEEIAARGIVDELGAHPLGLSVAAHLLGLEVGIRSIAEFRALLMEPSHDELELAEALRPELPNGHEASIAATLLRNIQTLSETGRDMLRIASVLAPAPIPKHLLIETIMRADAISDAEARRLVRDATSATYTISLTDTADVQGGAVLVHALVSRTMRFSDIGSVRAARLTEAVTAAVLDAMRRAQHTSTFSEVAEIVIHARKLALYMTNDNDRLDLLSLVALYDHYRGDYAPAERAQREILLAYEDMYGLEHSNTLAAMADLSRTRHVQGDLQEALRLQNKALSIRRRTDGSEHLRTVAVEHYVACTLTDLGKFRAAYELGNHVVMVRSKQLGQEHLDTLMAMLDLARTLNHEGKATAARQLEEEVLEARRRVLGEEHPDTLTAMGNLAVSLHAQGHLSTARQLEEEVLEVRRRVLGEEHPDTLTAMANLGINLYEAGDVAMGVQLGESVLEVRRRVLGDEHPSTLNSMGGLAAALYAQGEIEGACQLRKDAFEISSRVLGEEHPITLAAMNSLAMSLREQGDLAKARQLGARVVDVRRRVLGNEHPGTLAAMGSLAGTLHMLGDTVGARQLREAALETSRRALGDDHPTTITAMGNLADSLSAVGDLVGACELREVALETCKRALGENHRSTLTAMNNLAAVKFQQGDIVVARQLQGEAFEAFQRVLGEEHPDTLTAMDNLGASLRAEGELGRAKEILEHVLEMRRRILGDEHPATSITRASLKEVLKTQGNHDGARQLGEEARRLSSPKQRLVVRDPGRNDPCYCGSGKKFKRCHGQ